MLALVVLAAAACGGGPASPAWRQPHFTWTIDGEPFSANPHSPYVFRFSHWTSLLLAADCPRGSSIDIQFNDLATGTFPVDGPVTIFLWQKVPGHVGSDKWETGATNFGIASGTVTIRTLAYNWVSGHFEGVMRPEVNNVDRTTKRVAGDFELPFDNSRPPC